jgi:hypothetical protein
MFTIEEDITLADLDEAIRHISLMLKRDEFGNRMTWQKKQILLDSLDDLLDARIEAKNAEQACTDRELTV